VAAAIAACLCGPALVMHLVGAWLTPAAAASARPAPPPQQFLPWPAGLTVRVNQGNNSPPTHMSASSRYGWDFGLGYGEPVLLDITGVVVAAHGGCDPLDSATCNDGYGNTVKVAAGDGTCVRFEHLSALSVAPGQQLALGVRVGLVGSSGHSTGPHLHFQREVCATRRAIPSRFFEAGVPATGAYVTSALPPTAPSFATTVEVSATSAIPPASDVAITRSASAWGTGPNPRSGRSGPAFASATKITR
jgi:hypothetical protein